MPALHAFLRLLFVLAWLACVGASLGWIGAAVGSVIMSALEPSTIPSRAR